MSGPYPYARFGMPFAYAAGPDGVPLDGAKLYFYVSGTSQPLDTYADDALSFANENPVVANGAGIFPAIFLDPTRVYKAVLVRKSNSGNQTEDGATVWSADPVAIFNPEDTASERFVVSQLVVDGNGQVPSAGVCGDDFIPPACSLQYWVLQANEAGSLVLDVWARAFEVNNPPTAADSITASAQPSLDSAQSSTDSSLMGWTKDLAAQTALRYNIVSCATLTRFTFTLVGSVP
jgi:hypothetical protein